MRCLWMALALVLTYNTLYSQAGSCPEPTYHKTFRVNNGNVDVFELDAIETRKDYLYTVGGTELSKNSPDVGLLKKYDSSGELLWQKAYASGHESGQGWTMFTEVINTLDSNLLIAGMTAVNGTYTFPVLQKTDSGGTPIWTRFFASLYDYTKMDVVALPDSGFIYTYHYNMDWGPEMIGKLDKKGNPVWTKVFHYPDLYESGAIFDVPSRITYGDGALFMSFSLVEGLNGRRSAHLLRLDANTGNIIWEKKVDDPNFTLTFDHLYYQDHSLYIPYKLDSSNAPTRTTGRIRMDVNGNVQDIVHFVVPFASPIWMNFFKNDPFVASIYNNSQTQIGLIRIAPEGYVQWRYDYTTPAVNTISTAAITQTSTGGWVANSFYALPTDYGGSCWLTKVNSSGQMTGCTSDSNVQVGITHIPLNFVAGNIVNADTVLTIQPWSLNVTNQQVDTVTICSGQSLCNTMQLDHHNNVCTLNDTVTFTATKNGGCTLAVNWNYDTTAARAVASSESSIRLLFLKPGAFQLNGSLLTSCQILQDQVTIQVSAGNGAVNLGPDRVTCKGVTDTLHAGTGFMSYDWQDGSGDSIYKAQTPGAYSVTVADYCNNQYSAAVNLLAPLPVNFDLGPDKTICPGDTITVTPPTGFSNYVWTPVYRQVAGALPSLVVHPGTDTTYNCTAQAADGCSVIDSIRILLYPVTAINLSGPSEFCPGGEDLLDAGNGFLSYSWITGETTQQINVNKPGRYWVAATDANNCVVRDTAVVAWYVLPNLDLGPEVNLCTDSSHVFDAGKHFMSYLWQDGSEQSSFVANKAGTYWVQVIDSNGCVQGDTVVVLDKGKCIIGIYFPNAFTPNGDGKNDLFRPILFGTLDKFHLVVFDRYGGKVFETTDPSKGWDGDGKSSGTFVWYAQYHFAGSTDPVTIRKGTVIIVR